MLFYPSSLYLDAFFGILRRVKCYDESMKWHTFTLKLFGTVAVLLVLLAVWASALRLLAPLSDHYRPQVQKWLSRELASPVTVAHLSVNWRWFDPVISAHDVTVYDKSHSHRMLSINQIDMRINVLKSLWYRSWQTRFLTLDGLVISHSQHPLSFSPT